MLPKLGPCPRGGNGCSLRNWCVDSRLEQPRHCPGFSLGLGHGHRGQTSKRKMFKSLETHGPRKENPGGLLPLKPKGLLSERVIQAKRQLPSGHCRWVLCNPADGLSHRCSTWLGLLSQAPVSSPMVPWMPSIQSRWGFPAWHTERIEVPGSTHVRLH